MSNNVALIKLDVQQCAKLASLNLNGCEKLAQLIACNTAFTKLYINGLGSLSSLKLDDCDALKILECKRNALTSLSIARCPELWKIDITDNQLTEGAITSILSQLPTRDNNGQIILISALDTEQNAITDQHIITAYDKGWTPYIYIYSNYGDYTDIIPKPGGSTESNGDLNGDGNINAGDISELYAAILRGDNDTYYDLNSDGNVNAGDISTLYSIILAQ